MKAVWLIFHALLQGLCGCFHFYCPDEGWIFCLKTHTFLWFYRENLVSQFAVLFVIEGFCHVKEG